MRASASRVSRPLRQASRGVHNIHAPPAEAAPAPESHATAPFLQNGKAPASTLRTLVALHHQSASFMRDPSEIPNAFEAAFRDHTVQFRPYERFREGAIKAKEERAGGGLERLAVRGGGGAGFGARRDPMEPEPGEASAISRDVFRYPRKWTRRATPSAAELTERELKVKEALFGTWERGMDGVARPGLEGVVEVTTARGMTLQQAAEEWRKSEREVEEDSTEDGM